MVENVNIEDFLNARKKEINTIEKSIEQKKRTSQLFQTVPHYARRRNHSYSERKHKVKYRTKNRFIVRSHVYFAKRFKMLKLQLTNNLNIKRSDVSIPWKRNVKSKSFLNKGFANGYFIDESFKQIEEIDNNAPNSLDVNEFHTEKDVDFLRNKQTHMKIEYKRETFVQKYAIFKMFLANEKIKKKLKELVRKNNGITYKNKDTNQLDTFICIVDVKRHMETIVALEKMFIRAITIKELGTLAVEKDALTMYDLVDGALFKDIENLLADELIEKYNKTPPGKRNEIHDLNDVRIFTHEPVKYFTFKIPKGRADRGAYVLQNENIVGRVIRSEYKTKEGFNYGLCYLKKAHALNNLYIKKY